MNQIITWRGALATLALLGAVGCTGDLDVTNPNAPDAGRAFSDPSTIASLAGGSLRQWMVTRQAYNSSLLNNMMADAPTASWNNFNIRYYNSVNSDCPTRCGWVNSSSSAQGAQIETEWYGYYSALSSVNDAMVAIRNNEVIIGDAATTKMVETLGLMMQGMVFGEISLAYDQGFLVDEATDLSDPAALPLVTRAEMRDAAIAHLDEAYTMAKANSFTTPASWLGETQGKQYTNDQLAQVIRTLQAEYLAMFARNATENGQTDWAKVATYASQGISSGTAFEWEFFSDCNGAWCDQLKDWTNDNTTTRTDTRMAAVITAGPDPAKVHKTPWPSPNGNPQPDAYDKRVGDGTWGPEDDYLGTKTLEATANAGTDFAFAGSNPFPAARGLYHYSNLARVRYTYLAAAYYGGLLPNENGTGYDPILTPAHNDLLWAEGLVRSGGSKAQAAQLINKTRVGRGGLAPLAGTEDQTTLLRAIQYEQLIEEYDIGSMPFYNRRRVTPADYANSQPCPAEAVYCLWEDTPRHKPIPAKELQLLLKEIYTFGGQGKPEASPGVQAGTTSSVRSVREIFADMERATRALSKRKARN
jgi:hypothetical protein